MFHKEKFKRENRALNRNQISIFTRKSTVAEVADPAVYEFVVGEKCYL